MKETFNSVCQKTIAIVSVFKAVADMGKSKDYVGSALNFIQSIVDCSSTFKRPELRAG